MMPDVIGLPDKTKRILLKLKESIQTNDEEGFVLPNMSADLTKAKSVKKGQTTADEAYLPVFCFGTDATPPAASGFPEGAIYIQYTA